MERCKKILHKLLYPHPTLTFLLTVCSAAGLVYVFYRGLEEHPLAYGIYTLSFYALCALAAAAPSVFKRGKESVYRNTYAQRYLTQSELRLRTSLYSSTAFNLAYALFKLLTGVYFRSVWFGAVGVYYAVLSLIRFLLVRNDRKDKILKGQENHLLHQWKSCRTCGWLLLVLNAAMSGMAVQMIWQNKNYAYPGFVIYAAAAFTFYRLTMAVIRTVKMRKENNPMFAAAKALDLSVALMAIFALQTAMFASFGGTTDAETRQLMNALTGGAVCFSVVCIAAFMLVRSGKRIKELRINKTAT